MHDRVDVVSLSDGLPRHQSCYKPARVRKTNLAKWRKTTRVIRHHPPAKPECGAPSWRKTHQVSRDIPTVEGRGQIEKNPDRFSLLITPPARSHSVGKAGLIRRSRHVIMESEIAARPCYRYRENTATHPTKYGHPAAHLTTDRLGNGGILIHNSNGGIAATLMVDEFRNGMARVFDRSGTVKGGL